MNTSQTQKLGTNKALTDGPHVEQSVEMKARDDTSVLADAMNWANNAVSAKEQAQAQARDQTQARAKEQALANNQKPYGTQKDIEPYAEHAIKAKQDIERISTGLADALSNVTRQDQIFSTMNADELVEMAKRGMEEINTLRATNTKQLLKGCELFDQMTNSLTAKEQDLSRRQAMYTAIIKGGE